MPTREETAQQGKTEEKAKSVIPGENSAQTSADTSAAKAAENAEETVINTKPAASKNVAASKAAGTVADDDDDEDEDEEDEKTAKASTKKAKLYNVKFLKNHNFNIGIEKHEMKKGDTMKVELHTANKLAERNIATLIS